MNDTTLKIEGKKYVGVFTGIQKRGWEDMEGPDRGQGYWYIGHAHIENKVINKHYFFRFQTHYLDTQYKLHNGILFLYSKQPPYYLQIKPEDVSMYEDIVDLNLEKIVSKFEASLEDNPLENYPLIEIKGLKLDDIITRGISINSALLHTS